MKESGGLHPPGSVCAGGLLREQMWATHAPDFRGADGVEQDGRRLGQHHVTMVGVWQLGVLQDDARKVGGVLHLRAHVQEGGCAHAGGTSVTFFRMTPAK